jgi:PRA1 family protein
MPMNVSHGSDDNVSGGGQYESAIPHKTIAISIESMRLALSSFAARVSSRVSVDTLRSLPMFLGLNPGAGFCLSPLAFTPPVKKMDKGTPEKIRSRVKMNFAYFLSNYVLIASMTAIVIALMHPGMVFFLILLYLLWTLHAFLIRNQLVIFNIGIHSLLSVQQRFYGLFVMTTIVIIWKCLRPTLLFFTITSLLIMTHALLRDPKHIESSHSEKYGSGGGGDSDDEEGGGANSGDSGGSNDSEVFVERPRTTGSSSTTTTKSKSTTGRRRNVGDSN